jgi:hypothetical protein
MRVTEASVSEEEKVSLSRDLMIRHPDTKAEIEASEFDITPVRQAGQIYISCRV